MVIKFFTGVYHQTIQNILVFRGVTVYLLLKELINKNRK